MISDEQLLRYSRQLMLPGFDVAAQERLLASRVLLVGLGGLGSPIALYLAAAGVGALHLVDGDSVDASNLQRQIAHGEADIGGNKAESAAAACRAINADLELEVLGQHLSAADMPAAVAAADLVVDATDSFVTRLALNAACIAAAKPLLSGAAIGSEGHVTLFDVAAGSPCYRCLYPEGSAEQDLSCSESGVLAPIVGVIGTLQALEAVKYLAHFGETLTGSLLAIDGKTLETRRLTLTRNPQCPHCSSGSSPAGD